MVNKESNTRRSDLIYSILTGNKALLIVLVLMVILAFSTDTFMGRSNLLNVCRQICVSTLLSVGFTVVLASGHMDLSVGTLLGLSGMCVGLALRAGAPLPVAMMVGILMGICGGALNATLITVFRLPPFVCTLATQSVFEGTNYLLSHLEPVLVRNKTLLFIGQGYFLGIPVPVYIMLASVIAVWIIMNMTKFGRHVLAVGGNTAAAKVSGINVDVIRFAVYMLSGFFTGIASIVLTGRVASALPGAGIGMEMDAIAAVVVGGTSMAGGNANVFGTLFGCLVVGIVTNGMNLLGIDSNWQIIAKGVLILLAVIIDVLSSRSYAKRLSKQASLALKAELDELRRQREAGEIEEPKFMG